PLSLDVKSMAFLPIQRRGKIAAGLVVTSHKPEYFTQARQEVVYEYGSLLSLAFDDQDFYALEQLAFLIFPSIESQHEQESRFPFHLRIEQLRERLEDEQKVDQPLAQEQLMLLALQELEHDLIALRKRSHPARDS
ncbi:MAG TPA: hypothetical protein VFV38_35435, partial [Ktedonobacteraceae bacterium]|nr:hypothetical protein [Ktedonobacteraceae bacterium]